MRSNTTFSIWTRFINIRKFSSSCWCWCSYTYFSTSITKWSSCFRYWRDRNNYSNNCCGSSATAGTTASAAGAGGTAANAGAAAGNALKNAIPATGLKGFFVNPISFLTKTGPVVNRVQTYYTLSIEQIATTAAVATGLYYVTQWGLQQAGLNKETAHAAGLGVSLGYFAGHIASKLGLKILGFGSLGIGIAVGILTFILTFKSTKTQNYQFNCYVWQAPTGGQNCAQCNQGNIPCTEYTCKSLGQGCVLVNQGTNQELCVWNNSKDVVPPVMTPWTDVLANGYKYIPDNQQAPNDNGVRIVPINNNSGCVNSSSGVTLGLTLDKPGICKWDVQSLSSFDAMQFYFNASPTAKYNHSQYFPIPDPNALASENVTLENGNNYAFYTRCQSTNGYSSVGNFVFKFCVNPSPDTTAPAIVETSIINGSSIAFNQNNTGLMTVYVQDSNTVNCKWSKTDQDYSTMENNMNCPTSIFNANSKNVYACTTTLTGLLNSQNNNFYFRCQDNSPQKNVNSQSYAYVLKGTQTPLIITSIGPNGTIMNATSVIKSTLTATTFGGSDNGNSQCSFSPTNSSYVTFFSDAANTTNYQHSQDLYLVPGSYSYYIQCRDLGGNTATNQTSFTVQSDTTPPIVVRAYNDNNNLKIITDENSTCVYNTDSNIGCTYNFNDGASMQNSQGNVNQVAWDVTKTFYIKCMDNFGNQPDTDACSIIASPYSLSNSSQ